VRVIAEGGDIRTKTARDAMSPGILYCFVDESIEAVLENMGDQQIHRLPVIDRDKRLVGVRLLERMHASVRLTGPDLDGAKDVGLAWAAEKGLPFFEDGAEEPQLEGYAAIADEVLAQLPAPPGTVVAPVGNGALLAGIGRRLAERSPETSRVGVVAKDAPVMAESWQAGRPLIGDRCATFADGLAVRVAIPVAVDALAEVAQSMVLVSERHLARAVAAYASAGIRVEGAGAASLAALPQLDDAPEPIVLVVSGRNIDDELYERAVTRPDSFPD
jgi:threonine dehydratase